MRVYYVGLLGISAFLMVICLEPSIAQARDFIVYSPAGAPSLVVNGSTGYIGIGTAAPHAKLAVSGGGVTIGYEPSSVSGNDLLVAGKVGIGTNALNEKLNIMGTVGIVGNNPPSSLSAFSLGDYASAGYTWIQSSSRPLRINPSGQNIILGSTGYVGIGIQTPISKLHVEGNITLNNSLNYVNGNNSMIFDNLGNIIMQLG